jgi:hypothetical protein
VLVDKPLRAGPVVAAAALIGCLLVAIGAEIESLAMHLASLR